jgi:predicted dehydrogenase
MDYNRSALSLDAPDGSVTEIEVPQGDRFALQARSFLDSVENGTQHRVTASDGSRAIALLAQAYASAGPLVSTA